MKRRSSIIRSPCRLTYFQADKTARRLGNRPSQEVVSVAGSMAVKIPCTLERASSSSISAIRRRLTLAQRYDGGAAVALSTGVIAPPFAQRPLYVKTSVSDAFLALAAVGSEGDSAW